MEDLLFVVTIWLIGLATPIIGVAALKVFKIVLNRNEDLESWPKIFQKKEKETKNNSVRTCQICGEQGHYAKTCPHRSVKE